MKAEQPKRIIRLTTLLVLISGFGLASCDRDPAQLRVGLVGGFGSLHDGGFNQMAYTGLKTASGEMPIEWMARQSKSAADMDSSIQYFGRNGFDVIISLGFDAAPAALKAAGEYPDSKFILLDYSFETIPSNMVCAVYDIDQASFPCGFLAAWWAWRTDPAHPAAGYVAGPKIPEIDQFTVSFTKGVEYFNQKYRKSVDLVGKNATNFTDTLQGAHLADSLIRIGADVIFAVGGNMGNGALYKAKEHSIAAIGVDTDQYYTVPGVASSLLTSCMKRLDVNVYSELKSIYDGEFHGGQLLVSTLRNSGVDLAPYHDFTATIPDSIERDINLIRAGIMDGTIPTGWTRK